MRQLEKRHGALDHDAPKDTYGAPKFFEGSWRVVVIGGLLAGVLLAGVVFGAPAYRWARTQRGLRFAAECEKLLDTGVMEASGSRIHVALKLAPREPEVLRAAARYCSRYHLREGLAYYAMLIENPAATRQDRIEYAEFALALSRPDEAHKPIQALLRDHGNDPDGLRLSVAYLRQKERPNDALQIARNWSSSEPQNDGAAYVLGHTLLHRPDAAERAEGRRILWTLALGEGTYALSAAELLAPNAELTRGENEGLIRALTARAKPRVGDLIAAANIRIKLDATRKAEQM